MDGVGAFSPTAPMTRAAFLAVVTRWLFPDELNRVSVAAGSPWWEANYTVAVKNGLMKDGELNKQLGVAMKRQEMAVVLARAAQGLGLEPDTLIAVTDIPDHSAITGGYEQGVAYAYSLGLIGGVDDKGTFSPMGTLTRAQAAAVLHRLIVAGGEGRSWDPSRIDPTASMSTAEPDVVTPAPADNGIKEVNEEALEYFSADAIPKTTALMKEYAWVDPNDPFGEENAFMMLFGVPCIELESCGTVSVVASEGEILLPSNLHCWNKEDVEKQLKIIDSALSELASNDIREKVMKVAKAFSEADVETIERELDNGRYEWYKVSENWAVKINSNDFILNLADDDDPTEGPYEAFPLFKK